MSNLLPLPLAETRLIIQSRMRVTRISRVYNINLIAEKIGMHFNVLL